MHIENQNLRIVIMKKRSEAVVLLKRELYLSDIVADVVSELSNVNFSGKVVFDMLLIKGVAEHYYNMHFGNNAFDYGSNQILANPGLEIVNESKMYYRSHPELLIQTSLTQKQKNRVRVWIEEL